MAETWTVRRVIAWAQSDFERRGLHTPRLDADLLVARALGLTRIALFLDLDRPLNERELSAIRALVARRRRYEPVAYLTGEREFYGHMFEVTPAVLIPRPDTETLVERGLGLLATVLPAGEVLDVCTGSGAIAIALALGSDRQVVASDVSEAALAVAARNGERLGAGQRVRWLHGDLFAALPAGRQFACITINPPYVGSHEFATLPPDVRDHEPRLALDAGVDALSFYRRIAEAAPRHLLPQGALLVEVGMGQAHAVSALFAAAGLSDLMVHRDLGGIERVVVARGR